jgi:hypothetical protein
LNASKRLLNVFLSGFTSIDAVGTEFGCTRTTMDPIVWTGRKGNLARDMAVYLARDLAGENAQSLRAYFGGISGAEITTRYKHMSQKTAQSERLRTRLKNFGV